MKIPVSGRDAPFLPIGPERILLDGGPQFRGRESTSRREALHSARDIDANKDAANIKDNGAEFGGRHLYSTCRLKARPGIYSPFWLNATGPRGAAGAFLERSAPMTAGRIEIMAT